MNERQEQWERLNADVIACRRCPRLVAWREQVAREKRRAFREEEYWGKPVPGFGDRRAKLIVVGLAPAAHGANRTGRMFSGDSSGRTLIPALYRAGFANMASSERRGDGLALQGAYLTAIVRCCPPANKPTAEEQANCRVYLLRELALLREAKAVLALGRIAFDGYLRALREQGVALRGLTFAHGAEYHLPDLLPILLASYHRSRQNTQTGRLSQAMLDEVLARASQAAYD
jgi:uracil-DNA glycosylase family 4